MQMTQLIRAIGPVDAKSIRRDSFLIFMFGFVVVIAIVLRWGMPWLNNYLIDAGVLPSATIPQSLADYYPLLVAFMCIFQGSLIVGAIFGFMLLDEKDDNTLLAMMVTPVPLWQYVLYRVGLPAIFAFAIVIMMVLFVGQALIPIWQLVLIAIGAAVTAPIGSLFYGTFAANKVQGFAIAKFVGVAGWIILGAWFVSEPWQWLFGLFPPYWISKAYWMILEGRSLWWAVLLVGIVYQAIAIWFLARLFSQRTYRG